MLLRSFGHKHLHLKSVGTPRRRGISELLTRISHPTRARDVAVISSQTSGQQSQTQSYTYADIDKQSRLLAAHLSPLIPPSSPFIGGYHSGEVNYIVSMLACWHLGKTFVPLSTMHPEHELRYFVTDSKIALLLHSLPESLSSTTTMGTLSRLQVPLLHVPTLLSSPLPLPTTISAAPAAPASPGSQAHPVDASKDMQTGALVLYTSGTTGSPKGVLHTRDGLQKMIEALTFAWEYTSSDSILHFLPLHHLHGVLNKLLCTLWAGGQVEFLPSAKASVVWRRLSEEGKLIESNDKEKEMKEGKKRLTMMQAVPTVYAKLLEASRGCGASTSTSPSSIELALALKALKAMRFHSCGSAALPDPIMQGWLDLTGHTLLERYGMSELGMVLSNPYKEVGERKRRAGHVGYPLKYNECIIVDEEEKVITQAETAGELRVKGPCVFTSYLNKSDAYKASFDARGYFKTGDTAIYSHDNSFKLLGRTSTDIIKSGGYKLSALEIERELLGHPQIAEAAVLGIADDTMGEKVVAIITLDSNATGMSSADGVIDPASPYTTVKKFLSTRLAPYKQPRAVLVVASIPRNHLGKVNKKSLLKDLGVDRSSFSS